MVAAKSSKLFAPYLFSSNQNPADQVGDQVKALLAVLGGKTFSALGIMNELGLSHRPTFRQNYLQPALEKKLIEMTIPHKPKSSLQRYRATSKGKRFLLDLKENQN